jgi:hypothetical protein
MPPVRTSCRPAHTEASMDPNPNMVLLLLKETPLLQLNVSSLQPGKADRSPRSRGEPRTRPISRMGRPAGHWPWIAVLIPVLTSTLRFDSLIKALTEREVRSRRRGLTHHQPEARQMLLRKLRPKSYVHIPPDSPKPVWNPVRKSHNRKALAFVPSWFTSTLTRRCEMGVVVEVGERANQLGRLGRRPAQNTPGRFLARLQPGSWTWPVLTLFVTHAYKSTQTTNRRCCRAGPG